CFNRIQRGYGGPHDKGHGGRRKAHEWVGQLAKRKINLFPNLGLIVSIEAMMPYVPHYPYDFSCAKKLKPESIADGVPPTKSALRHYLVNRNYKVVADAILLVKESASEQRNAHGLQIVWRHHEHQ